MKKMRLPPRGMVAAFLLAGMMMPLAAQDGTADALPADMTDQPVGDGGDDEGFAGFDSGDFFGDEEQVATDVDSKDTQSQNFLSEEGVRWGGNFALQVKAGTMYRKDYADWTPEYLLSGGTFDALGTAANENIENSALSLSGSLWFSARPDENLRYYGKLNIDYPFDNLVSLVDSGGDTSEIAVPNLSVWELFADLNINKTVFIRAGKQMVKWGVGYFYQPADIISLSAVDVYDPTADREGPLAIKANVPLGLNNLDLYAVAPSDSEIESITDVGLAGRFKFVVADWEMALGSAWQTDKDWQFIATASGSLSEFNVFAEGRVNRLASGAHIQSDGSLVTERDDWFFSGTAGLVYTNADAYLTAVAQYYYNGEGYDDPASMVDDAMVQVGMGNMSMTDLYGNLGTHYAAAMVSWTFYKDSPFGVSLLWLGSLSDGSGMIKPSFSWDITDELVLTVSPYFAYGPYNSQYRGIDPALMGGSTAGLMPTGQCSVTLDIAAGKF